MKRLNLTIGIIGCGNMGSAILSGLLRNHISRPNQVLIYDSVRSKMQTTSRRFKVKAARSSLDLVQRTQVILLAVKPQDLGSLAAEIGASCCAPLRSHRVVISILAGTPVSKVKRVLGAGVPVVRAMPNLGAQVGEAVTAVTGSENHAIHIAEIIFSGCGKVVRLPEKYFDLVTAVSGSGPAYFFLMMELLSDAAKKGGIPVKVANLLAVQTAAGAGRLAQSSSASPGELRKMVTSKKGTTEAALRFLLKRGFHKVFSGAITQALKRARELSRW